MSLLSETRCLLACARKCHSLRAIARDSGVSYEWLKKFAGSKDGEPLVRNPTVTRVQALHKRLTEIAASRNAA